MDIDWRKNAACLGRDPELFFPIGTDDFSLGQVREAKDVCRGCQAIAACLAWAVTNGPVAGIWGGTAENERTIAGRGDMAVVGPTGGGSSTGRAESRDGWRREVDASKQTLRSGEVL